MLRPLFTSSSWAHVFKLQYFFAPLVPSPAKIPYTNDVHAGVDEHSEAHTSMPLTSCAPPPTPAIAPSPGQTAEHNIVYPDGH